MVTVFSDAYMGPCCFPFRDLGHASSPGVKELRPGSMLRSVGQPRGMDIRSGLFIYTKLRGSNQNGQYGEKSAHTPNLEGSS